MTEETGHSGAGGALHDPMHERLDQVIEYVKERAVAIGGTLVAVLLGFAMLSWWTGHTERKAYAGQAELGERLEEFANESRDPEAGHEACLDLASDHRGTSTALQARYLAALWLERGDDLTGALDEIEELADDVEPTSLLALVVEDARTRLLEANGKHDEAADLLVARIEAAGEASPSEAVVMAAARNLEAAGRADEARSVLEEFLAHGAGGANLGFGGGSASVWARAKLATLPAET